MSRVLYLYIAGKLAVLGTSSIVINCLEISTKIVKLVAPSSKIPVREFYDLYIEN